MSSGWRELGAAARRLRRAPGFTAAAVATLALGLGVSLAMFSALYAALWQPLPYPAAGRLVRFAGAMGAYHDVQILPHLAQALTAPGSQTLSAVGLYGSQELVVTGLGPAQQVDTLVASPELFEALGVAPERGRALAAADARPGALPVALVSDAFWRTQLHSAALAGLSLNLDGVPHAVVGVLPPDFAKFDQDFGELLVPLNAENSSAVALWAVGRLRPGVGIAAARAEATARATRVPLLSGRPPEGVEVLELSGWLRGMLGGVPWYLLGAAGLILLLACVNAASLLLARISGRRREFAIRQALGASRTRLLVQVMSEALLLAWGGGVAAWALAWALLRGLTVMHPHPPAWLASTGFASPMRIGFVILASLIAGLACSLAPAWRAARRPQQVQELAPRRLGGGVIAFETALALVLAVAAGLLIRTVARLEAVPLGFDPAGVLTADFVLPPARYKADAAKQEFFSRLLERVQAMPGVASAGLASPLPFDGETMALATVSGQKKPVLISSTSPEFFRALGVRVTEGRGFQLADRAGTPRVALVNQTLAQAWWPGQNPLGQQFAIKSQPGPWMVVGVVNDFHWFGRDEAVGPAAFFPQAQLPLLDNVGLMLRSRGDVGPMGLALKRTAMGLDADVVVQPQPMTRVLGSDIRQQFYLELLAVAAGLALLLAAVGVYGTVSYWVGERRQEMGVRMALGARPVQVERQVLTRTLRWAVAGAVLGAGGAVAAGRALSSLLFEVKPGDPASLAAGTLLLLAVAAGAAWWPARRAGRVDPVAALRHE
ncbi:MAG: ADOP family duplicated permease [Terriglobales bacterium]